LRVFTSRDAATLLTGLARGAPLSTLGAALGFAEPLPLDKPTRRRLGLEATVGRVQIQPGPGTLRALLITANAALATVVRGTAPARVAQATLQSADSASVATLARAVARAAPERGWLLLHLDATAQRLSIAAPPSDARSTVPVYSLNLGELRESDAETLAALVGCREGPDLMVHLRWRETLGRTALTRRFYQELERGVAQLAATAEGRAPLEARRSIALLHTSRLLFVSFLEARGWLNDNREFLRTQFVRLASGGSSAHRRLLDPLWFGTLNTPFAKRASAARAFGRVPFLNGGLFTRTALERQHRDLRLQDDALESIVGGLLSRYRLTARESREEWAEAAVDPEMLGRAFESLMHDSLRRSRGAFYTPPALITQLSREGLVTAFAAQGVSEEHLQRIWDGERITRRARQTLARALEGFRVLDPSCGSGAFLVYVLEELAMLRAQAGDERPAGQRRRDVLTRCIYGVDVDPTAVWLCQLRLWLSVVVEEDVKDPMRLPPLPNLDRNVREGDALAGRGFEDGWLPTDAALESRRLRYSRASGLRKRTLGRALEREERQRALHIEGARVTALSNERRELLAAARAPDLFRTRRGIDRAMRARLDDLKAAIKRSKQQIAELTRGAALPFSWLTHFPEPAQRGGFSMVIGNPPWVRTHAIAADQRAALRERFSVFRLAAWESGASEAAAGRGFSSQVDLAALFAERAVRLTQRDGAIALLLPAKLWGSLAGGGLRQFLAAQAPPLLLEEWQDSSAGFDAVVYPSALVARRRGALPSGDALRVVAHRHEVPLPWTLARARLALDDTPGAPWLLLPAEVRDAFDALSAAGVALSRSSLARPQLGVKCGLNEAFVLTRSEAEREAIERQCLRPLLRGEHLAAWRPLRESERAAILWTHDAKGAPLRALPERAHSRLSRWRRQLEQRSDGRGGPWWALFRTEAARSDRARVVWGDIGRAPRALVLPTGDPTVPLNTCYVVRTPTDDDAHALAALLNSTLGAAWLSALAEPARGGYRRFLGWTCARFPVPRDWERARGLLAATGRAAADGVEPNPWELTDAVLEAYQLPHSAVAALLSWHSL